MSSIFNKINFYRITNVDHTASHGAMFIHYWASIDNDRALIDCMADSGLNALLVTDFFGNTALHYAAATSSYLAASFLVGAFRSQHFFNINMITPSHLASIMGDLKMLELLTKSDVMMNDLTNNNWSNLHFAIFYEHYDVVKYLLENCNGLKYINSLIICAEKDMVLEKLDNKRLRFCSPLDLAKNVGNQKIVDLLISYNALPSLHAAIVTKDLRGVSYHLFSKESPYFNNLNFRAEFKNCTPLHLASAYGNYQLCNVLVQNGASTDIEDDNGMTPLDLSIIMDYFRVFSILLLKTNIKCLSKACFIASDLNRTKYLSALVKLNLDLNYVNADGDSVLIHLLKRKMDSFVLKLLSTKPKLDFKDVFGLTIFHYSALVSSKLISTIPNFNFESKDNNNVIPLSYALLADNEVGFQLLKDKSSSELTDSFGMTPVIYSFLSENSLPINNNVANSKFTINVKKFIESEIKIPSKIKFFNYSKGEEEEIPCDSICIYSKLYESVVKSKAMSLFIEKTDGILHKGTLLHAAILFGSRSGIIAQILDSFPNLIDVPDDLNRTPLQLATMLRKENYVALLINRNASLFHKDNENNSLFHFIDDPSVFSCLHDIANNIVIGTDYVNNKGETPIHLLCKNGSIQVLKLFITIIENQSIFSAPDNEGNTPLDFAFKAHSQECIDFLHSVGVKNKLITSIKNNDLEQLSMLIKEGYNVNSFDKSLYTPLHIAVKMNSIEMTKFLLQNGADVKLTTANGLTPLHVAAQQNNLEICCLLLEQDIRLAERLPEEQPYLIATDPKVYSFLLHYWKRQYFISKFFDFNYNNQRIIGLIKIFLSKLIQIVKPEDKLYNFVLAFKNVIQSIEFVSSKIRSMKTKRPHQFNYMKSIHHLLMILTTVDIKQYVEQFQKFIVVAESIFFENSNFKSSSLDSYLIFLFPMQWSIYIKEFLEKFKPHLLPDIDDLVLFNAITKNLQQSTQIVTSNFNLVQDKIIEQLPSQYEKEIISTINQGYISSYANCVISNISTVNQYIFIPQNYLEVIHMFSNCFELPRTIPFENKEHLHALIKGNYFIISNSKESFLIPFFFLNSRISAEGKLEIFTPVGSFTLSFNQNNTMYFFFKYSLSYQTTIIQKYDFGERGVNEIQTIYQCFVVFQLRSDSKLRFHTMNVRASQESECFDICYSKINESLQAPPIFFNIMSIDIKELPGLFTVIQ